MALADSSGFAALPAWKIAKQIRNVIIGGIFLLFLLTNNQLKGACDTLGSPLTEQLEKGTVGIDGYERRAYPTMQKSPFQAYKGDAQDSMYVGASSQEELPGENRPTGESTHKENKVQTDAPTRRLGKRHGNKNAKSGTSTKAQEAGQGKDSGKKAEAKAEIKTEIKAEKKVEKKDETKTETEARKKPLGQELTQGARAKEPSGPSKAAQNPVNQRLSEPPKLSVEEKRKLRDAIQMLSAMANVMERGQSQGEAIRSSVCAQSVPISCNGETKNEHLKVKEINSNTIHNLLSFLRVLITKLKRKAASEVGEEGDAASIKLLAERSNILWELFWKDEKLREQILQKLAVEMVPLDLFQRNSLATSVKTTLPRNVMAKLSLVDLLVLGIIQAFEVAMKYDWFMPWMLQGILKEFDHKTEDTLTGFWRSN